MLNFAVPAVHTSLAENLAYRAGVWQRNINEQDSIHPVEATLHILHGTPELSIALERQDGWKA